MNSNRNVGPHFSAAHGRYVEHTWRDSAIQHQQYTGERRPRPQRSTMRVRLFLIGVIVGLVVGLVVAHHAAAAECMTDLECEQRHSSEVGHG